MSTTYLSLKPDTDPFPLALDDSDRVLFAFNVRAECDPTEQFEEELIGLLVNAGVGTWTPVDNRDIFAGPKAVIPTGDGPYLLIMPSGGASPLDTHNQIRDTHRPAAQITTRAASYTAARGMAWDAHAALDIRNTEVVAA